jgi:hypothetical protein
MVKSCRSALSIVREMRAPAQTRAAGDARRRSGVPESGCSTETWLVRSIPLTSGMRQIADHRVPRRRQQKFGAAA